MHGTFVRPVGGAIVRPDLPEALIAPVEEEIVPGIPLRPARAHACDAGDKRDAIRRNQTQSGLTAASACRGIDSTLRRVHAVRRHARARAARDQNSWLGVIRASSTDGDQRGIT